MTEYIANMLTKNMYMDGLIEESEESIYSYSIQLIVEKIIGFSAIYMIALFQGYFFETSLKLLYRGGRWNGSYRRK